HVAKQTTSRPVMAPTLFKSVEVVDAHTVQVNTTGRADFLYYPQPILVIPKDSFGKVNFATQANGTGPFKLQTFVSGTSMTTVANESYWGGAPGLGGIFLQFFADEATEAANIRSGQVDALYDVLPLFIDQVNKIPNTRVVKDAIYIDLWIPQMGKPPLNDVRVRRAIRYCFDKKQMNAASFHGHGIATWNPFNFTPIGTKYDASHEY